MAKTRVRILIKYFGAFTPYKKMALCFPQRHSFDFNLLIGLYYPYSNDAISSFEYGRRLLTVSWLDTLSSFTEQ